MRGREGEKWTDLEADDLVNIWEKLDGLGAVVHGGGSHHTDVAKSVTNLGNQDAELVQEALSLFVHSQLANITNKIECAVGSMRDK